MSTLDLNGKTALVTGASRGIGKAIAIALGRSGAAVGVVARATDERRFKLPGTVDETARLIEEAGGRAAAIPGDLTSVEEVDRVVDAVLDRLGPVDILVNNAAIDFLTPFLEVTRKRFDLTLGLNLLAPFWLAKHLVPGMIERGGGYVLNVSSQAALRHFSSGLTYGMTKAALERFTMGLAAELEGKNISSNCLRVDVPIASEGFVLNFADKGLDETRWESVEVGAEAALWMLAQTPADFNGVNIGITELRERYGLPARVPYRG